jgi:hypothetical protein
VSAAAFDLEDRARELLDAARVVLEGPCTSYDSSGHQAPDSRPPVGNGTPTLQTVAQRLHDAQTGEELLRAIHWAELTIYRVRHAGRASRRHEPAGRVRARVLADWVGAPPEQVADMEPVTVAQVCGWRAAAQRDPITGAAQTGPAPRHWRTPEERAVVIASLHAAEPHLSMRALAMLVGVSHPTVLADLSRMRGH